MMHISQIKNVFWPSDNYKIDEMKIISGGQTGADQAGLRAAQKHSISTGGWAPNDWRTQDGFQEHLLRSFNLEPAEGSYAGRTALNVRDSDVTLRFAGDFSSAGERCTFNAICKYKKPFIDFDFPINLTDENAITIAELVIANDYKVINIAGNAERTCSGIGIAVEEFLVKVILAVKAYSM